MFEAAHYIKLSTTEIQCLLCPHLCKIKSGKTGICRVRKNIDNTLYSLNYGKISGYHSDPIEKKPLYHFYPGSKILSIGSYGCNMKCSFCQNCEISQVESNDFVASVHKTSAEIAKEAVNIQNNLGVAYTYNEPAVWYEFMYETARLIYDADLKNVVVSNGYFEKKPLNELLPIIHAFNIDLKAFNESFYRSITKAGLNPVLENLVQIKKADKHLEITNLIIPGENDDQEEFTRMIHWIVKYLGKDTILHLSKYFPNYKMDVPSTPSDTIEDLYEIAVNQLHYVYIGNMFSNVGKHTKCPYCGNVLILREDYHTQLAGIDESGTCSKCKNKINVIL